MPKFNFINKPINEPDQSFNFISDQSKALKTYESILLLSFIPICLLLTRSRQQSPRGRSLIGECQCSSWFFLTGRSVLSVADLLCLVEDLCIFVRLRSVCHGWLTRSSDCCTFWSINLRGVIHWPRSPTQDLHKHQGAAGWTPWQQEQWSILP